MQYYIIYNVIQVKYRLYYNNLINVKKKYQLVFYNYIINLKKLLIEMFQQNVSSSSDFTASQGFEQFLNAKGKKEEEKTLDKYLPTSAKVH